MQQALGGGVQEYRRIAGMELAVGDDLIELFHALRLHVDHVVHLSAVIDMPEVHSEVVGGEEVLAVGGEAQRVDVVLVGAAVQGAAFPFPSLIYNF